MFLSFLGLIGSDEGLKMVDSEGSPMGERGLPSLCLTKRGPIYRRNGLRSGKKRRLELLRFIISDMIDGLGSPWKDGLIICMRVVIQTFDQ